MSNDKDFEIEFANTEKSDVKKTDELVFHSLTEETLVKDIMKIDIGEAERELDKRVVVQHNDRRVNVDCFNAFAKNVLIRDENGKKIIINNHEEIHLYQKRNSLKEKQAEKKTNQPIINNIEDDIEFD